MVKLSRLTSSQDFRLVYRKGKSVANRYLVLYSLKRLEGGNRIGIAVSRGLTRAVDRNRIKRVLREAWRQKGRVLNEPYDVIIVGRTTLLDQKSQVATAALADVIKKSGLERRET